MPLDEPIGKAVLVDKKKINRIWTADEDDVKFETPFSEEAARMSDLQRPAYDPDRENRVEELFHRQPFYFGQVGDDEDEDDEDDYDPLATPRHMRGSSDFLDRKLVDEDASP